ncbi:MAG: response regulator, partial [Bacteroidetes bacterium]
FTHTNGSVTISISSLCNEHCTIDISDTGIGIPSTALGKLFSTEERYSTSGTKGEQGNGVGLLLTYEILARHRGSISIDSEIGKGTVVHLTLRHAFQNNAAILLVDDDPVVRLLHTNYLSRIFPSYKIVQAADGIEALKQAESVLPSLIVTDYSMPNMNGIQLIQELKKNPATSDIPIIAATGDSSNANHEALILSGARAVVLKPLVNSEFQTIAEKIFHEQQKEAVAVNDR